MKNDQHPSALARISFIIAVFIGSIGPILHFVFHR